MSEALNHIREIWRRRPKPRTVLEFWKALAVQLTRKFCEGRKCDHTGVQDTHVVDTSNACRKKEKMQILPAGKMNKSKRAEICL